MALPQTNMLQQSPYRKRLRVGDVFCIAYPEQRFLFGQIISLSASAGGFDNCIKIYIYDRISKDEEVPSELTSFDLICQPLFVNRLGFSRGYMPVVANLPLPTTTRQKEWCFHDVIFKRYFNEVGEELDSPTELVGTWGLSNYLVLDDCISEKLGLRAIDD